MLRPNDTIVNIAKNRRSNIRTKKERKYSIQNQIHSQALKNKLCALNPIQHEANKKTYQQAYQR
jgi:hypothetical protein